MNNKIKGALSLGLVGALSTGLAVNGLAQTDNTNSVAKKGVYDATNVITIFADDVGYFDILTNAGMQNSAGESYYEAPNMQRLASMGMTFTNAHAYPVCSPTRVSMLSGQYTDRVGFYSATGYGNPGDDDNFVYDMPNGATYNEYLTKDSKTLLDINEKTYADEFKEQGYATGYFGKNHTGNVAMEDRGFDYDYGCQVSGPDNYYPTFTNGSWSYGNNMGNFNYDVVESEHIADRMAREARYFIEDRVKSDEAFMFTYAEFNVHAPFQAKKEYIEYFQNKNVEGDPRSEHVLMATMIKSLDDAVGVILDTLEEYDLLDNTHITFMADNGGNYYNELSMDIENTEDLLYPTTSFPFRGGKGTPYEGGTRIPCIAYNKELIKPSTFSSEAVSVVDLYPTILDVAGLKVTEGKVLDGLSLKPLFKTPESSLARPGVFTNWSRLAPAAGGQAAIKINTREWVLLYNLEVYGGYYDRFELYHIPTDIGQVNNLADVYPQKVEELYSYIEEHLRGVEGAMLTENPKYNEDYSYENDGLPLFVEVRLGEDKAHREKIADWQEQGLLDCYTNAMFKGEINYHNEDKTVNDTLKDVVMLSSETPTIYANSLPLQMTKSTKIIDEKLYVPFDLAMDKHYYSIRKMTSSMTASRYGNTYELTSESNKVKLNDENITLSNAVVKEGNNYFVEINDFATILNKTVHLVNGVYILANEGMFTTETMADDAVVKQMIDLYKSALDPETREYIAIDYHDPYTQAMNKDKEMSYYKEPILTEGINPIAFDFTTASDTLGWTVTPNVTAEVGAVGPKGENVLKFSPSSSDGQLIKEGLSINANSYNFLKITYRNLAYGNAMQIFFRAENDVFTGQNCVNATTKIGTSDFVTMYIPLGGAGWKGSIYSVRLDLVDTASMGSMYIKEIAFISGTASPSYDFTNGKDGFIAPSAKLDHNDDGSVTFSGSNLAQGFIMNTQSVNFNADTFKYLNVTYKNMTDNTNVLVYYMTSSMTKFDADHLSEGKAVVKNYNEDYDTISIDLSKCADWSGNIIGLRFGIQGPGGGSVTIDRLWMSNVPATEVLKAKTDWTFDNNADGFTAGNANTTLTHTNGAITYTNTENNMNTAFIVNSNVDFSAEEYNTINITYKNTTTNTNLVLYYMAEGITAFHADYRKQATVAVGETENFVTSSMIIDTKTWNGDVTALRLSINGADHGEVTFDRIWFSYTEVEDGGGEVVVPTNGEWNFTDSAEGFAGVDATIAHNDEGTISYDITANASHMRIDGLTLNTADYTHINFIYKNTSANIQIVIFFLVGDMQNYSDQCRIVDTTSGGTNMTEFKTVSIPIAVTKWEGALSSIRIGVQGPNRGTVTYDKLWLSNESGETTDPEDPLAYKEVAYDFADGVGDFTAGNGTEMTYENGAVTYTGDNMNTAHIKNMKSSVDANVYKYLNVSYKNNSANTSLIFYFISEKSTPNFVNLVSHPNKVQNNNQDFAVESINLTNNAEWKDTITSFRVSIQGAGAGSVTIDKIWFSSIPFTREMTGTGWDFNDDANGFSLGQGTEMTHANGAVTYSTTSMNAGFIKNHQVSVNASEYKFINFTYKNNSKATSIIFFFLVEGMINYDNAYSVQVGGKLEQNNEDYVTVSIPLTNANWAGNVTGIRLSLQGSTEAGSVTFDQIWFSK